MTFIAVLVASLCASAGHYSAHAAYSAAVVAGQGKYKPSVTVYVFAATPPAESDEGAAAGRAEAVRDMRDALRKKAGLEIVNERSAADVLVEVVGREQREAPQGGFGGMSVTKTGDTIIRLRVTSGDDEVEVKGIGQGTWGRAAKDAADRVLKWIARRERKGRGSRTPSEPRQ